jgi:hypothetical protein
MPTATASTPPVPPRAKVDDQELCQPRARFRDLPAPARFREGDAGNIFSCQVPRKRRGRYFPSGFSSDTPYSLAIAANGNVGDMAITSDGKVLAVITNNGLNIVPLP